MAQFSGHAFGAPALGDSGHDHGPKHSREAMEQAKELHRGHKHAHDFKALDELSSEDALRMIGLMQDIGLAMPPMDSARGRELFVNTGCVACHSVIGVGGEIGPSLNADDMPVPMNAFEFAARMWRGAPAMVSMQDDFSVKRSN